MSQKPINYTKIEPIHKGSKKLNVDGGTWTPTDFSTRPSNVRVYQFRHSDKAPFFGCYFYLIVNKNYFNTKK